MLFDTTKKFDEFWNAEEGFHLKSERCVQEIFQAQPYSQIQLLKQWMLVAYQQGCKDMAQDTLECLGDYAAAVSGLASIHHDASEVYCSVANSLDLYYEQIFPDKSV